MAFLNFLTLFLCTHAMLAMISIPASHCRTIKPEDDQLIENVCSKTPNYNVCIQFLFSTPGSSSADVKGLALNMANVMKASASFALNQIQQLQNGATEPLLCALSSCAGKYNAIFETYIPQAIEALQRGDPLSAENGANNAANEANNCESEFDGNSPLSQQNNDMYNVASVAAAIARQLL